MMKVIDSSTNLSDIPKGCVLTIGNFDGVHIGHQEILIAAKRIAAQKAVELIVMTFQPHPVTILQPKKNSGILTPLVLKKHLLAEFGADCLFALKSSPELLSLSPHDFAQQFLVKNIQPDVVIEGENFKFGSGRRGNIHTLYNLGVEKGFEVIAIESKAAKLSIGRSVIVSSTMIRNMLGSGRVADAAVALARPYRLIGPVVPGRGKGKKLGFPTLNLENLQQLVPAEGVYAGTVELADSIKEVCGEREKIPAAFSIGRAETFGSDNPLVVEAHILTDDVGDLSGKWLAMDFIKRIRSQQKFNNEEELSKQIGEDCSKAKKILQSPECQ